MKTHSHAIVTLAFLLTFGAASAQTKWDLPTAYPASNFHTENIVAFAAEVDKATGGKLKIQVHANASLLRRRRSSVRCRGGRPSSARCCG